MKRIILTIDNRFKHWDLSGKHPDGIIVTDDIALALSQDTQNLQYDINTKTIIPFVKTLDEEKLIVSAVVLRDKSQSISNDVTSSALGGEHRYSSDPDTLILINLMISLTNGGNVNCINSGGIEKQRAHSHQHLLRLAQDIIISRNDIFDILEAKNEATETAKDFIELSNVLG